MIKNFDILKVQLKELSSIINQFKSESVQLKIVELIFKGVETDPSDEETTNSEVEIKRKRKKIKKNENAVKENVNREKKKSNRKSSSGPAPVLEELIKEDYFKIPKTLADIIEHSVSKKARNFKPNELSTPLARFVRSGKLKRDKNKDGQYQYQKA